LRLDKDKNGTLNVQELEQMTSAKLLQRYNVDWEDIIRECDFNGDGVIDF
jgi:Ca2+-binding EF-hand superfamily protein